MEPTENNDLGQLIYKNDCPPQRMKNKTIDRLIILGILFMIASAILFITPRFFGLFDRLGLEELGQIPRFHFAIAFIISLIAYIKAKKQHLHQIEIYEKGLKLNGYYKGFELLYDDLRGLEPNYNWDSITIKPKESTYKILNSNKKQNFTETIEHLVATYEAHTGKSIHTMTTDQLSTTLHSETMKTYEADFALTPKREKYMLFGAIPTLFFTEGESPKTLSSKKELLSKVRLWARWNIKDETTAHYALKATSRAEMDASRAEEFFQAGQITGAQHLSNFYLNNPEKYNDLLAELVVTSNNRDYDKADQILTSEFGYTKEELMGMNLDDLPTQMVMLSVVAQNTHDAHHFLINNFNYTEAELANITSLIALDLARPAYLAKVLLSRAMLPAEDMWPYIEEAGQKALTTYNNWREFVAAYVIGRTFMYNGIDSSDSKFYAVIDYLLNHPESPYQTTEFKTTKLTR